MKQELKFSPEDPKRDQEAIEALTSGEGEDELKKRGINVSRYFRGEEQFKTKNDPKIESEEGEEAPEDFFQKGRELRMDEANPNWARNIERDSMRGKLYRFIEIEFSEFRLRTVPRKENPDIISVEVTPYETDRKTLYSIENNKIFRVLAMSRSDGQDIKKVFEMGLELEKEGQIPKGTTKKALARFYSYEIDRFWKMMEETKSSVDKRQYLEQIKTYETKLHELGEKPLSEGEMEALFRQVIDQEMEQS
ncbi:MAG: hypothetical protein AAB884_01605 [Patescibacteria group bacterium]